MKGREITLRLKLMLAFVAVAMLAVAVGVIGLLGLRQATDRTAREGAENVAGAIAEAVSSELRSHKNRHQIDRSLQRFTDNLTTSAHRDIAVVDRSGTIRADAVRRHIGLKFREDPSGEVSKTMRDRIVRTFTEKTPEDPNGIKQIAVPVVDRRGTVHGVVVLEYSSLTAQASSITDELQAAVLAGAVAALAIALLFGRAISRWFVRRLNRIQQALGELAEGRTTVRLPVDSRDELGRLEHSLNLTVERLASAQADLEQRYRDETLDRKEQVELSEALQAARTELEAHLVLERRLESSLAGSRVVIMNRNNSADRLLATTGLEENSPLAEVLRQARPDSCVAIRLGRPYNRSAADAPLLECDICGKLGAGSTCLPSLVGGEVIGSVLIEHSKPLDDSDHALAGDSVSMAAPILANLRNLQVAQARASTDELTGLPNNRSIQHNLKRMVAKAGRELTPLCALMLDLDHFKDINDRYGHGVGDEVLAAVGQVLLNTVRGEDFAGRAGGEEFILLLPNTDEEGGRVVAENIRRGVSEILVPGMDGSVTASVGLAVFPRDAADSDSLVRMADRALYAAKGSGRDRVTVAVGSPK
jgi:two-component system, cell cycle response regulator